MGDYFHKFGTLMLFGKTYMLHSGPTLGMQQLDTEAKSQHN